MSEESVRQIVLKAFGDAGYRAMLLSDMQKAVEEFDLTETEYRNLESLFGDFFDEMLSVEERISRGFDWN